MVKTATIALGMVKKRMHQGSPCNPAVITSSDG